MLRRSLVAGLLTGTSIALPVQAVSRLQVIYIGGWDCPICRQWKNTQKPQWFKSPEYSKVDYIEVESPKLREAYESQNWPANLRPILSQLTTRSGTPRFLLVKDGKIVGNYGSHWSTAYIDIKSQVQ